MLGCGSYFPWMCSNPTAMMQIKAMLAGQVTSLVVGVLCLLLQTVVVFRCSVAAGCILAGTYSGVLAQHLLVVYLLLLLQRTWLSGPPQPSPGSTSKCPLHSCRLMGVRSSSTSSGLARQGSSGCCSSSSCCSHVNLIGGVIGGLHPGTASALSCKEQCSNWAS